MYLRRNSPILRVKAEAALSKIVNFLHDHDGGWYLEDRNNYDKIWDRFDQMYSNRVNVRISGFS